MKVIGIDLGGTKIAAAVVNEHGKILSELKVPTHSSAGWPTLRNQIIQVCNELEKKHKGIRSIGIGSAGPLHAPSGTLLDPTNFGWKSPLKVKITSELSKKLEKKVVLENDAASAALAEHWKGKSGKNAVTITLGTGLGVGVIAEGKLIRGGRGLHPETGHLLLRQGDKSALCGCGNYGCSEAFLSGKNFAARMGVKLKNPELTGEILVKLRKENHPIIVEGFHEYAQILAEFLHNIVVLFYPEKVIFTGSFASASSYFLPETHKILYSLIERRLKTIPLMPELRASSLGNKAGVLGAAYIALHKNYSA